MLNLIQKYSGPILPIDRAQISPLGQRFAWTLFSIASFFILWALLSALLQSRYLPSPGEVYTALVEAYRTGELINDLLATLGRVAASFVISMFIGSAIGIALGRSLRINRFFDSWLLLFLNMPALVTIVLCYIWFGLNEVAAITAVALNKIPNVAVTLREGARALDRKYYEMARVYQLGPWKTFRHVIMPQLNPFFAAAARSGLALIWKIVLVVEFLGRNNGVGFQIHLRFQLFDVAGILAYAIAFIVIIQAIELLLLQPWERQVNRWRL